MIDSAHNGEEPQVAKIYQGLLRSMAHGDAIAGDFRTPHDFVEQRETDLFPVAFLASSSDCVGHWTI